MRVGNTFRALLILLASAMFASPALASPRITELTKTYPVSALTAQGLRREMGSYGPGRFWALTQWDIRWDSKCNVTVRVTYTLPKHTNPGGMPTLVAGAWNRMLRNLVAHERLHGANGIAAAKEISTARCRGAKKILRKYQNADRTLDRETQHGSRAGVVLP